MLKTDKEIAKVVIEKDFLDETHALYPSCKALLGLTSHMPFNYCPCCGQKIKWWGNSEGA